MARLWLPGASIATTSSHDGGSMIDDGHVRWVWHTWECGYSRDVKTAAGLLKDWGREVHLIFNPVLGGIAQLLPANRAARGLKNAAGGCQTNRLGKVCLQVEVIAYARNPWTDDLTAAGYRDLARMVDWARSWGIPDVWPAGPPPAYIPGRGNVPADPRSVSVWTKHSGHFGHSQIPENDHGDPGAIDIRVLFQEEDDVDLLDRLPVSGWAQANLTNAGWDPPMTEVEVRGALAYAASGAIAASVRTQQILDLVQQLIGRPAVDVDALAAQLAVETDIEAIKTALREVIPELRVSLPADDGEE